MLELIAATSQSVVDLLFWVTAISAVLGLFVAVVKIIGPPFRAMKSTIDWLEEFRESWEGSPAAPGRSAVPGVLERLNRIDGELNHNSGSSIKDAVVSISESIVDLREQVDRMEVRQIQLAKVSEANSRTGKDAIERGNYNARLMWDAIHKHGIDVAEPLPYREVPDGSIG